MTTKLEPYDDWINGLYESLEGLRWRGKADPLLLDALQQYLGRLGQLTPKELRSRASIKMAAFQGDDAGKGAYEIVYNQFLPAFALVAACSTSLPGTSYWNELMG